MSEHAPERPDDFTDQSGVVNVLLSTCTGTGESTTCREIVDVQSTGDINVLAVTYNQSPSEMLEDVRSAIGDCVGRLKVIHVDGSADTQERGVTFRHEQVVGLREPKI